MNSKIKNNYFIHQSKFIKENAEFFYKECLEGKERHKIMFPTENSTTWSYKKYNTFALTAGSIIFYKLFIELKNIIHDYCKTKEPLWFQSWINIHEEDEVLNWHSHFNSIAHGYISINPEKTKTVFENFEIDNKIGQIYIGESNKKHKVVVLNGFKKKRITIAFDVIDLKTFNKIKKKDGNDINLSFFPL
jgi:hypothetical protein|tara:strand:+ start:5875 stop:6444 length:570 start_codon:yes stop_codon:yes gene_type:complete